MEIKLPNDFKEFLRLLHSHGVRYLLIGGYAVGYYGYPRATADMDIWIESEATNAQKVVDVLAAFGFYGSEIHPQLFLQDLSMVRLGVPPLRLEITTKISGVEFDDCYPARTVGELDGVEVSLISLEMLKQNKRASGRAKDLDDLEHLK
jgi:hypothetical protein